MYIKDYISKQESMINIYINVLMAKILVDDRERVVIPFLNKYSVDFHINYEVMRMVVGDYAVVHNEHILMIIERKSWTDLAASMYDGRKENIHKLLKLRELTNCKIIYLIEGNPAPNPNKRFGKIPASQLRAHLDHLILRDGIFIINSIDVEDTARRLFEFVRNFTTIKPSMFKHIHNTETNIHILSIDDNHVDNKGDDNHVDNKGDNHVDNKGDNKGDNHVDDKVDNITIEFIDDILTEPVINNIEVKKKINKRTINKQSKTDIVGGNQQLLTTLSIANPNEHIACQEQFLSCLPTVGRVISVLMANAGITLAKILHDKIDVNFIACLKYDTGACIGLTKAERILENKRLFTSNSKQAKLLTCKILKSIKGISKNTATIISNTYQLSDLMNGKITASELSNISKGKTKLGETIATRMIMQLGLK